MSLNDQLSELFHNFAALMELKGENVFKVIAFQKVGRIIRELNIDLKKSAEEGKLGEIEGIGKSSQQIIEEFIETGKSSAYEDLAKSIPAGLVPMLGIEGIGPKTINLFWKQVGITSFEELSKAIADGKLAKIKGMGEKKIATIQKGIEDYKARVAGGGVNRRTGIADAMEQAEPLVQAVRTIAGVSRAEIAGSLRRCKETIGDVDLIAAVGDVSVAGSVIEEFVKLPGVIQTLGAGESKASVKVANGMQVDLRVVPNENFGAALLYFTGSKEHNVKIRGLAQKQKMTLNEWGLYEIAKYEKAKKETAKPPMLPTTETADDSDSPFMARSAQKKFNARLRRSPFPHSVPSSLPVLFFGDLLTARIATVGLNPSDQEYMDSDGEELAGLLRRFETLTSLNTDLRENLSDDQCAQAISTMRAYFQKNKPVYRWFNSLNRVLQGMGKDYTSGNAVHLDLVQEATNPTWSKLRTIAPEELDKLRMQDIPFLRWQIETFPLSVVLCNGRTALDEVKELLKAEEVASGTMAAVRWSVAVAKLDNRKMAVAGWNIPLARPTGLKSEDEKNLGKVLAEAIAHIGININDGESSRHRSEKSRFLAPVASESEESIYAALDMVYVEPEMREDLGEIELSRENKLPKLITIKDIRGDLHTHTNASDGRNTIEEMAAAAKAAGYEFLAITDHSKAMAMANGLSVDRLIKHIEQIHKISANLKGITLLAGSEVDILADGRMDYEDDVLKLLDIVVASPHVSLKQDAKKATDRLLRAIDNKYVNIIGHPTGRLINGRAGLPLEMDKLYQAAAANGTALEINAGYPRLDLNDIHARAALAAGCKLAIDTDSHTANFEEIKWGIGVARRAWATPKHVINCMKLVDLKKFLATKRDR